LTNNRKGIILAGGTGSRLFPLTNASSKQLLPVYDKPMIYYPLCTLMLAGIKEILIIVNKVSKFHFENLLKDGHHLGIKIKYEIQERPEGLAQAFLIAENFLQDSPSALILGDNLFHGNDFTRQLKKTNLNDNKNTIFVYPVRDPERYGIVEFDKNGMALSIEEKPKIPKSKFAVTGLYFYDNTVVNKAKLIKPSQRGELEITSINQLYLENGELNVELLGRGMAWLDTGTFDSLHEAGSYIKTLEQRQGLKVGCPEEVAWRNNWIDDDQLEFLAKKQLSSGYGDYLIRLIEQKDQLLFRYDI
tara:strand:- start:1667 stop:2575 length:909 start_codon:yes stop_codon:yes gene_type:complete